MVAEEVKVVTKEDLLAEIKELWRSAADLSKEIREVWLKVARLPEEAVVAGGGPAPEVGPLIDGTGTGEPPVPPRYSDTRPGELINLDEPLFGYQDSDSQRGFCGGCQEPASEHACPEVKE